MKLPIYLKRIIDLISLLGSLLLAWLFSRPSKRIDDVIKNENGVVHDDSSGTEFVGKTVVVLEYVTSESGVVRFSGSYWQARLSNGLESNTIPVGESAIIQSTEGNTLYVTKT